MTKEEIREGNELIAKFMRLPMHKTVHAFSGNTSKIEPFMNWKYHSSWDWLMPMVEKIESMGYVSTIEKRYDVDENRVWFNDSLTLEEIAHGARDENKLIAVYIAFVDFIKWHNSKSN